jgi:CDP-glycerol glycerophosphotransferase (TagB/SpsB family)
MLGAIINHMNVLEYYDHLVPLGEMIGVPVFVGDDPLSFATCKKYYPDVDIRELSFEKCTAKSLVENFNFLIFPSHVTLEEQYLAAEEAKQGKKLCKIFCPHGFSDKTYYWQDYSEKDFIFVYGQNMFDIFDEIGISLEKDKCIFVGNYRYDYFMRHREQQMRLVKEEVFKGVDLSRETLFYAPTCCDDVNASTFFDGIALIIERLPDHFNLVIKAHPRIISRYSEKYYQILSKYVQRDNVVFVEEFPCIYPILECCDYYLGDMSSIGYDFLTYDKPMFFINKERKIHHAERERYLFRCGTSLEMSQLPDLYDIIAAEIPRDKETFSAVRKEVYAYTFGEPIPPERIKTDFEQKISHFFSGSH